MLPQYLVSLAVFLLGASGAPVESRYRREDKSQKYVHFDFQVVKEDKSKRFRQELAQQMVIPVLNTSLYGSSVMKGAMIDDQNGLDDDNDNPAIVVSKRDFSVNMPSSSGYASVTISNRNTYYSMPLLVGSNKQSVSALLDTGSSDLWLPEQELVSKSGFFNPDKSSSFQKVPDFDFQIHYGDNSSAIGYYGKDYVAVQGTSINVTNVEFAVAVTATAKQPVFGIGLPENEAQGKNYTNFPLLLKEQGFIDRTTYSLYLNSSESATGSILFGAQDTAKYEGNLVKLPLVSIDDANQPVDSPVAFFINTTSVTASSGMSNSRNLGMTFSRSHSDTTGAFLNTSSLIMGNTPNTLTINNTSIHNAIANITNKDLGPSLKTVTPNHHRISSLDNDILANTKASTISTELSHLGNKSFPGLLDSGTTLTYFPESVFTKVGEKYGTLYDSSVGYLLPCDKNNDTTFHFEFGESVTIDVPFNDLKYPLTANSQPVTFTDGSHACLLGVLKSPFDYYIFGDSFLRNAYVHYDLDNYKVGIAQVKYTEQSNIVVD